LRLSFCYYGIQHDCTKADVMQYGNGIKVTGSMSKIRIVRNVIIVALLRAVILHDSSTVSTTENVRMFVKTILTFFLQLLQVSGLLQMRSVGRSL